MDGLMFCCAPCKPRYRRLVDAIYPRSLTEGLIHTNMQKLTFYAISQPEKLDRIGEYIVWRMSRDLYRQRYNQVKISVEAMDQLLQSCHDLSSLNQFIESFLKMLQKLLETNNFQMEKLATDSFVNFANIEENTPAYHRQYDFFISKFAAMCHSNQGEDAKAIRYAGLRGLRGVLWKSATDPLQASIWEKQHMDKIVPSILFNLQDDDSLESEDTAETVMNAPFLDQPYAVDGVADSPKTLSDQFLRELMAKAPFGLISVLEPVLKHCDLHKKWEPPATFAVTTFRAIMYSIKDPYFVIQALINHLENMSSSNASVRIGIATVLSSIVSIAGTSIGPSLLGIFNSLLKHLRQSVEFQQSKDCPSVEQEKIYQETLINAMGDYANALPDYQKVEIMMFTVGNIPKLSEDGRALKPGDAFLQHVLVKTLLKVATKYKTAYLATIFADSFLSTLLQLALVADPCVRLDTQHIFHTLLDRHDNLSLLQHVPYVPDVADLQLTVEKCSRADQMFMQKHVVAFTNMLYKSVCLVPERREGDMAEHIDAILCTMALLCVEVGIDEVIIELFRLSFALQSIAVDSSSGFKGSKRIAVHNMVARYLNLSSQLMAIPSLCQHVQQVVKERAVRGHLSLNLMAEGNAMGTYNGATSNEEEEHAAVGLEEDASLLFDKNDVAEMLKASGKDVQRFAIPFVTKGNLLAVGDGSQNDGGSSRAATDKTDNFSGMANGAAQSILDESALSIDMSIDWSPPESRLASRRNTFFAVSRDRDNVLALPLTVEALRHMISAPVDAGEEERREQERTHEILEKFRNRPFDELVEHVHNENEETDLSRTLHRLMQRSNDTNRLNEYILREKPKNIFELKMPASFVY
uniref:Protein EFR3 n=1 Tax=Ascaris suum TaxID=6253 RepID=F1KW28_ASCSU